jgi:hypothetical protein
MRKIISLTLLAILSLPSPAAQAADVLTLSNFSNVTTKDWWSVEFAPDGNTLYFAPDGGTTGLRRVEISSFLANGAPIDPSLDGYAAFRSAHPDWQISDLAISPAAGKNGHPWVYATGGNIMKSVPADSLNRTASGVVWTIDRTTNEIEWMTAKRSTGNWQQGQMHALTMTPDGRYVYAYGWAGSGQTPEIFKYSTATNTQVGLGIPIPTDGGYPVADDTALYTVNGAGITKMVIDADYTTSNHDSAPGLMAIRWTNTPFNFSDNWSTTIINNEIYLTTGASGIIAVVDPITGIGTTYDIQNLGANKFQSGLKMGVDGCIYTIATNRSNFSVNKIDLNLSSAIATTGNLTYFRTNWENAVTMNSAGTLYVISPDDKRSQNLKYVTITGSACGGRASHSGAPRNEQVNQGTPIIDHEALKRIAEEERAKRVKLAKESVNKKVRSGDPVTSHDLSEAEMGSPSAEAMVEINKALASVPLDQRSDLAAANRIVKKYLALDILTSPQVTGITARNLVEVEIFTENTPQKSLILRVIRLMDISNRDSFGKITEIIQNQVNIYEARKARLASIVSRYK